MAGFSKIMQLKISAALQDIVKAARENLIAKGHHDTGELHNSIGARVSESSGTIRGVIEFLGYGLAQDTGIKSGNIPFGGGGGGGRSKYIEGLAAWVQRKGMETDAKKAKGIAFAIAKKHKELGMHTSNKRAAPEKQGWFSEPVKDSESKMDAAVDLALSEALTASITNMVNEANRNNGKK